MQSQCGQTLLLWFQWNWNFGTPRESSQKELYLLSRIYSRGHCQHHTDGLCSPRPALSTGMVHVVVGTDPEALVHSVRFTASSVGNFCHGKDVLTLTGSLSNNSGSWTTSYNSVETLRSKQAEFWAKEYAPENFLFSDFVTIHMIYLLGKRHKSWCNLYTSHCLLLK